MAVPANPLAQPQTRGGPGIDVPGLRFHLRPEHMPAPYATPSAGNTNPEDPPRATVQRFDADGGGQSTFATGLRNPVGIAFHPDTDELYVVVNERDGLGDGLVPD